MIHHQDHAGHHHAPRNLGSAFAIGTGLASELGFGYLSNSLASILDRVHNFPHVLGRLLVGPVVAYGNRLPHAPYGYRRASIFAALTNALYGNC